MADIKKTKSLTPKRPDREFYVPRYRKATVKSVDPNQVEKKCDGISEKLNRSYDLPPKSLIKGEKRPYQIVDASNDVGEFAGSLNEISNDDCRRNSLSRIEVAEPDGCRGSVEAETHDEYGSRQAFEMQHNDPSIAEGNSIESLKSPQNQPHGSIAPRNAQDFTEAEAAIADDTTGVDNGIVSREQSAGKEMISPLDENEKCKVKSHRKMKIHRKGKKDNQARENTENNKSKFDSKMRNDSINDNSECTGDDDWFDKWDETGNCISEEAKDELAKLTEIENPIILEAKKPEIDYYSFSPVKYNLQDNEFRHLAELYSFSPDVKTSDLSLALQSMGLKDFDIKWVDDTHAIGVFSTESQAQQAIKSSSLLLKIRPITEGTKETQLKVSSFKDMLLPYKSRPETTVAIARNLVTSALGIKTNTTKEQRAAERQRIVAAKERKKQKERNAKDAWGD